MLFPDCEEQNVTLRLTQLGGQREITQHAPKYLWRRSTSVYVDRRENRARAGNIRAQMCTYWGEGIKGRTAAWVFGLHSTAPREAGPQRTRWGFQDLKNWTELCRAQDRIYGLCRKVKDQLPPAGALNGGLSHCPPSWSITRHSLAESAAAGKGWFSWAHSNYIWLNLFLQQFCFRESINLLELSSFLCSVFLIYNHCCPCQSQR